MKKVTWGAPKISSAKRTPGTYGSFQELLQKSNAIRAEQEQAQEFLKKAHPAMLALLEHKLRNNEPLVVMRPLRYQTSTLGADEEDDGFYAVNKSAQDPKFRDVVRTILPGTQLVLKALDMSLQEFIFHDASGNEHALNFCERDNLLTQTSIFEEVKAYFENKGDQK